MAKVTVGMPVYNAAACLGCTLAAMSAQTYSDMQVVVSDNASTDDTAKIVQEWAAKDPRIIYRRQPENIGAMANFSWLIRNATSPWFMFAAHDDLWSPNYVDELVRAAEATPGMLLSVPRVKLVTPAGLETADYPFHESLAGATGLWRIFLLFRHVRSGWHYALYNQEAQLAAWEAVGRFGHAWGNDFIMLLPFILSGKITGSNDAVFRQCVTDASVKRYKPKTLKDQARILADFLRESLRLLALAPIPCWQKIILLPRVVYYASERSWRITRLIRHGVKALFRRGSQSGD